MAHFDIVQFCDSIFAIAPIAHWLAQLILNLRYHELANGCLVPHSFDQLPHHLDRVGQSGWLDIPDVHGLSHVDGDEQSPQQMHSMLA